MDVRVGLWTKLNTEKLMLLFGVVREDSWESLGPLDCKEIQPVNPKGNQSWIFIGRTDGKAETPIFCPPDVKNWLIRKEPDSGKYWGQEEKGMTKDEKVGWHRLDGWVWASSGSWWWTGRPGVMQSMGSQSRTWLSDWTDWLTKVKEAKATCCIIPLGLQGSNQLILKEISPECSLEGLMLKLKLQYFGHLMWRTDSLEKTPILGKI